MRNILSMTLKIFTLTMLAFLFAHGAGANSTLRKEIAEMNRMANESALKIISEQDIMDLPEPVQGYLRFVNMPGTEEIKTVRLRQGGYFRLKPDKKWMPIRAEQDVNIDSMEFVWTGKVRGITAVDKFVDGLGSLTVKLFGIIPVAKASGPEIDQGELMRFLGEGVWFPSLFLKDYVEWQTISSNSARATIRAGDLSASVIFDFAESGAVTRMTAKRYMEVDGKFVLRDWEISNFEYREFHGLRIPYKCDVIWKLPEGDFCYDRIEITEITYNPGFTQ